MVEVDRVPKKIRYIGNSQLTSFKIAATERLFFAAARLRAAVPLYTAVAAWPDYSAVLHLVWLVALQVQ